MMTRFIRHRTALLLSTLAAILVPSPGFAVGNLLNNPGFDDGLSGAWFTWTDTPGEIDWMTLQGGFDGTVATLQIYRSSGGRFNDPAEVTSVPIGIAEFRFLSCVD